MRCRWRNPSGRRVYTLCQWDGFRMGLRSRKRVYQPVTLLDFCMKQKHPRSRSMGLSNPDQNAPAGKRTYPFKTSFAFSISTKLNLDMFQGGAHSAQLLEQVKIEDLLRHKPNEFQGEVTAALSQVLKRSHHLLPTQSDWNPRVCNNCADRQSFQRRRLPQHIPRLESIG